MTASRVLAAVAARSVSAEEADIALPQYRVLVVLASPGAQRIADLAELLEVNSSNATGTATGCNARAWYDATATPVDRRAVRVSLTPAGERLVRQVTIVRRAEIARVLATMPDDAHGPLLTRAALLHRRRR